MTGHCYDSLLDGVVLDRGGCWIWCGKTTSDGYGLVANRKTKLVHRVVYEWLRGLIPKGLTLDHLCRNTRCCNPDHLEPVTVRENIYRGLGAGVVNAQKTHCDYGHPLSGSNLRLEKLLKYETFGRRCKLCINLRRMERRIKIAAARRTECAG